MLGESAANLPVVLLLINLQCNGSPIDAEEHKQHDLCNQLGEGQQLNEEVLNKFGMQKESIALDDDYVEGNHSKVDQH